MDKKVRSEIDPQNMFQAIYDFPDHMADAIRIGSAINLKNDYSGIKNIVLAGMGGSAIGGDVAHMLISADIKIPFKVSRGYTLPNWVGVDTLVICSSYSGNTEETLSAFAEARQQQAQICGITTGGKIGELLTVNGYDKIDIIPGLQPRAALAYSFVTILYLLNKIAVIGSDFAAHLQASIDLLKTVRNEYSATKDNPTLNIARKISKTLPIIYGETEATAIVANRWRGQISENAKMLAYSNELPEMNHNEIVGWMNNPELLKQLTVIWLQDTDDHPRVKLRQEISRELISDYCQQEVISVTGESRFVRLLHLIHFGDWLSYWLALEHSTDPTPVEKIMNLKDRLAKL